MPDGDLVLRIGDGSRVRVAPWALERPNLDKDDCGTAFVTQSPALGQPTQLPVPLKGADLARERPVMEHADTRTEYPASGAPSLCQPTPAAALFLDQPFAGTENAIPVYFAIPAVPLHNPASEPMTHVELMSETDGSDLGYTVPHPYLSDVALTDATAAPRYPVPPITPDDVALDDLDVGSDLCLMPDISSRIGAGAYGQLQLAIEDLYSTFAIDAQNRPQLDNIDHTAEFIRAAHFTVGAAGLAARQRHTSTGVPTDIAHTTTPMHVKSDSTDAVMSDHPSVPLWGAALEDRMNYDTPYDDAALGSSEGTDDASYYTSCPPDEGPVTPEHGFTGFTVNTE